MCQPALTSRTHSRKSTDTSKALRGRKIAQAITARGSTVAISSATCRLWELGNRRGGGSHGGNRLAVDKKDGNVRYSSMVCSTSVTPIRANTVLREREGMGDEPWYSQLCVFTSHFCERKLIIVRSARLGLFWLSRN